MRFVLLLTTIAATACGGKSAPTLSAPEAGPAGVVDQFMRAVADSNFTAMAGQWGTSRGPASETGQPSDYQRRIQVIYAYLRGTTASVLGELERSADRVMLAVEMRRADCRRQVTWTLVRTGDTRWIVNAIDLGQLGVPGRPCPSDNRQP